MKIVVKVEMNKITSKYLIAGVALLIVILIGVFEVLEITNQDVQSTLHQNRGAVFAISLLIFFWAIYSSGRDKEVKQSTKPMYIVKFILSCYAIGGVIFLISLVVAWVSVGVSGIDFVAANVVWVMTIGFVLSIPFVYKFLK